MATRGIGVAVGATVLLAVTNRVLYKLALVPMKGYPFFLAQVTTFGYVAVYFSILFLRYRAGIVTKEMLSIPKVNFVVIGILEALGVASGMSAGAMLPGPAIPILSQSFLVWQIIFSILFLRKSYSLKQLLGCFLVISGVIIAIASGSDEARLLSNVELIWPTIMIVSSAFHAGASILKEYIFIDGERRLKVTLQCDYQFKPPVLRFILRLLRGKRPDIFVVNSFGSAFQSLFVFLLLPLLSNLRGIRFGDLPEYLNDGVACFLNARDDQVACDGAPFLPLLFIIANMTFNISLLNLVKMSSALVGSLTTALAVPLSIYVLSLPLPYIPHGSRLSSSFVLGASVLLLGLILYNLPKSPKQQKKE